MYIQMHIFYSRILDTLELYITVRYIYVNICILFNYKMNLHVHIRFLNILML